MAIELTPTTLNDSPPGGWRVTVTATNHTIQHYDYISFRNAYEQHCVGNGIPLGPLWEEELLDRICKENQPLWSNHCKRIGKFTPIKKAGNFGALMTFLRMIERWLKDVASGEQAFVDQDTADARSLICATCPYNTQQLTFGCGTCGTSFFSLVASLLGKTIKSKAHDKIGQCGICLCATQVSVWVPLEVQQQALSDDTKRLFRENVQSFCWKAQGL